ncbi:MAG: transcriptional regulator [Thermoplasmata archaeon]
MADETLTPNAKKVYEAMKKLGASSEDKLKTADDIMKAASMGKGLVNNALQELMNKGYVKRIARQKSAGYYLIK